MDLNEVLKAMEEGQTKVAAATAPENPEALENAESEALAGALSKAAQAVTAPESSDPVDSLMQMAESLAGAEKDAEVAFAALCGQAFGDALINKMAAYNAQAQQVAALPETVTNENALSKIAAEILEQNNPELVQKIAAEAGYADTMEKAAADYQAGQQEALKDVHTLAVGEFLKGAAETEVLLNKYREVLAQQ